MKTLVLGSSLHHYLACRRGYRRTRLSSTIRRAPYLAGHWDLMVILMAAAADQEGLADQADLAARVLLHLDHPQK